MNYDTMKAAELKALCELRGITPHRAKAVMIADLKASDAADELSREANVQQFEDDVLAGRVGGVVPASEDVPELRDHPEPENPAEGDVWLSDGSFYKRYDAEGPYLGDDEHEENLRDIMDQARQRHLFPYGPPFRAANECGLGYWVYAVNVR